MLDCRYFRAPYCGRGPTQYEPCAPDAEPANAMLGAEQWAWLEEQLRKTGAALRIIASRCARAFSQNTARTSPPARARATLANTRGTKLATLLCLFAAARSSQVVADATAVDSTAEGWSAFPRERARLARLVRTTRARGVVFISGDVHYAEISRWNGTGDEIDTPPYALYDITSSGLTQTFPFATANSRRIAGPEMQPNWGELAINWDAQELTFAVHSPRDGGGREEIMSRTVSFAELTADPANEKNAAPGHVRCPRPLSERSVEASAALHCSDASIGRVAPDK